MSILECGLDLRNICIYKHARQYLLSYKNYSSTGAWRANVRNVNFHSGCLGRCATLWCISLQRSLQWCSWEIQKIKTSKTSFHFLFSLNYSQHTTYSQLWCNCKFQETLQPSFLHFCQGMLCRGCILYIVNNNE